jgi:hypothetical protein
MARNLLTSSATISCLVGILLSGFSYIYAAAAYDDDDDENYM